MKRMDCLAPLYNAGLKPFCFRKQYQRQKHKDKEKKNMIKLMWFPASVFMDSTVPEMLSPSIMVANRSSYM